MGAGKGLPRQVQGPTEKLANGVQARSWPDCVFSPSVGTGRVLPHDDVRR